MLYVVSTPIGNLEDITLRGLRILKECDLILCEDTRRTLKLLSHYNISNKLSVYNDINKRKKTPLIIKELNQDKTVALVSDSGTPGINDPGFYLVRECIKHGIDVSPVPGPSSVISALVCSGHPTDNFEFLGFVPKTSGKRIKFIEGLKGKNSTSIMFESPHRILKTVKAMSEVIPDKQIVIAREMTKKFEEFISGTCIEVYEKIKNKKLKGEIVIIIR